MVSRMPGDEGRKRGGSGKGASGASGASGGAPRGQQRTPPASRSAPRARRGAAGGPPNQRVFVAVVVLLVVVGAGVLGYLANRPKPVAARTLDAAVPASAATGHTLGRSDAPVHIMEFADFECPACANYTVVTEPDVRRRIIDSGYAQVTYYDFPLPQHKNTLVASEAAACAGDQGKFWEMHDRLFQGQTEWNGETTSDPEKVMRGYAQTLGLDVPRWQQCVEQGAHQRDIAANKAEGEQLHVNETPTFVIGNRVLPGAITFDELHAYVDSARGRGPGAPAHTSAAR